MANFDQALPWILAHEGGWADDPDDPGGATNFGITLATAQRHGIPNKTQLCLITPEQVSDIYRADYWRFSGVVSQGVATKIFDMAVNFGMNAAVKLVQGALNDLGADLTVDGVWGPKTETCMNAVERQRMLDILVWESILKYKGIVAHRPESHKFLGGWLRRAHEVPND